MLKSRLNTEQGEKLMTSLAHHWEQQGVEKGMQIGRNEGMQIGRNEERYKVAKNLLAQNININTISVATGLTVDEITKLKNS